MIRHERCLSLAPNITLSLQIVYVKHYLLGNLEIVTINVIS